MVIPRKHLHELKTSRKIVRKGWRLKRYWVVRCTKGACSLRHVYLDEKTARFAAQYIEDAQLSRPVFLSDGP